MQAKFKVTRRKLLLCEGPHDAAFIRHFLRERSKGHADIDVQPVGDIGVTRGDTGFEEALANLPAADPRALLTNIGLIVDADENYDAQFKRVCAQIRKASSSKMAGGKYAVPKEAFKPTTRQPKLTVLMMPGPKRLGSIDTLLWDSICATPSAAQIVAAIDTACKSTAVHKWPNSPAAKARLRMYVALSHRKNPAISMAMLWDEAPSLIPTSHRVFDDLLRALNAAMDVT